MLLVLAVLAGARVVGALGVLVVLLRTGAEVTAGALVTGAGRAGALVVGALATLVGDLRRRPRSARFFRTLTQTKTRNDR